MRAPGRKEPQSSLGQLVLEVELDALLMREGCRSGPIELTAYYQKVGTFPVSLTAMQLEIKTASPRLITCPIKSTFPCLTR